MRPAGTTLQGTPAQLLTDRAALDLADADAIVSVVREVRPQLIVNAAAYTNVERAESEPDLARRINAEAPAVMAEEARALEALQHGAVAPMPEQDWVRQSLLGLAPVTAGRFFLHGSHDRHRRRPGGVSIEIDAGTAFGTGHHGTTEG